MASSGDDMEDVDEDLISCHVCLLRFDEELHKPKYLDCHHSFCMMCIKDLIKREETVISCPCCRKRTIFSPTKTIADLSTNNYALRLGTLAADVAKEKKVENSSLKKQAEPKRVRPWCVNCSKLGTFACHDSKHLLFEFDDVYNEKFILTNGQLSKCHHILDEIVDGHQKVQEVYATVLDSLRNIEAFINNKVELSDSCIAMALSEKQGTQELPIIPVEDDGTEEELIKTMKSMDDIHEQLRRVIASSEDSLSTTQILLNNIKVTEEQCANVTIKNSQPRKKALKPIAMLKDLKLSFSGEKFDNPLIKSCVSVLSFLILALSKEQSNVSGATGRLNEIESAENGVSNNLAADLSSSSLKKDETRSPQKNEATTIEGNSNAKAARWNNNPANKNQYKMPKKWVDKKHSESEQDSRGMKSISTPRTFGNYEDFSTYRALMNEITAPFSNPLVPVICYLQFSIGGRQSDRVLIQLYSDSAPKMSSRFIEFCKSSSYNGTTLSKACSRMIMAGDIDLRSCPNLDKLIPADKSEVKERRGSIRFHIHSTQNGSAMISSQFLIVLSERQEQLKYTTVFGHIIEGYALCERLSKMDLAQTNVAIVSSGIVPS